MKTEINRCMGCMNEKLYSGPCEICGRTGTEENPAGCLGVKTLLGDRYVIGRLLSKGGEGAVYLAYDTKEDKITEIKEFMPDTLCGRAADGESVEVYDGSLPLFKSYLSEFADLHKTIMTTMGGSCIKRSYEIFAANGTGYVVTEHVDGVRLEEYLTSNGGKISWDSASVLLPPLLDTLARIHAQGIVHRGLSPETLYVSSNGGIVLTAMEISAARTADSRINFEVFPGYTACEQYSLSERQGTWTDIYGLCAVLYRMLTGTVPTSADGRKNVDKLVSPADINDDIPKYVSDAITDGMRVDIKERIHDIGTLRHRLYDPPAQMPDDDDEQAADENDGPVTPKVYVKFDDEEERVAEKRKAVKKKKEEKKKRANAGMVAGIVIFFALVAALVIAIIYFSEEAKNAQENPITAATTEAPEPEPEVTTARTTDTAAPVVTEKNQDKIIMPDLVGRLISQTEQKYISIFTFESEFEYTDDFTENQIMEQDVEPGTEVAVGSVIHLKVSQGPAYTYLPDYGGYTADDYLKQLAKLGVPYETEEIETTEVAAGYVDHCSVPIGAQVYITKDTTEVVTVYVAVAPAVTEPPETEPPATEPPETLPPQTEQTDGWQNGFIDYSDEVVDVIGEE